MIYASTRKAVDHLRPCSSAREFRRPATTRGSTTPRREVQNAFMSEKIRAIVATNAFGMGIDKPNVRLVIHYAMPGRSRHTTRKRDEPGATEIIPTSFCFTHFPIASRTSSSSRARIRREW